MRRLAEPSLIVLLAAAACATPRRREEPAGASAHSDAGAAEAPLASAIDAAPPPSVAHVPTILLLGDSHTYGAFGARLHERLAGLGRWAVVSEAAGGATTETYLEERPEALVGYRVRESAPGRGEPRLTVDRVRSPIDPLATLLARHDPDVVIVALGTNKPHAPVADACAAFLERVVRDRPRRRVFWIGPPAVGSDRGAPRVASLRAAVHEVPGAVFVDSTPFNASAPLPRDNPHFGPDDARRWADVVFAQLAPQLPVD